MKTKTMIGVGEVGRLLQVSVETVRTWSDNGKLHAERTGSGRRLFLAAEIEKYARLNVLKNASGIFLQMRKKRGHDK